MVRAPCCEKMRWKKGFWTPEEYQILVTYIQKYGHGNWRALPKQAGLLRCGRSCRLRWINYLRPDIKPGNFGRVEEETIIKLHEMLGNRRSAIAAKLPGRTDNKIKNVRHTSLKKRLKQSNHNVVAQEITKRHDQHSAKAEAVLHDYMEINRPISSPQSSLITDISSMTITNHDNKNNNNKKSTSMKADSPRNFSEIANDKSFWSEVLSTDRSNYSETLLVLKIINLIYWAFVGC